MTRVAAETRGIRVGSGGVMLPHYSPMKVAEVFRMLHAMYPGRIDLGVGRAPGSGGLEAFALRRERTTRAQNDDFLEQLAELRGYLYHEFPAEHPFNRIRLSPEIPGAPDVWLLGSSQWSAVAAANQGLPYSFAHFIGPEETSTAIRIYRQNFEKSKRFAQPKAMIAL